MNRRRGDWERERKGEGARGCMPLNEVYWFRSTFAIIKTFENGDSPDQMMMTFHPQWWTDKKMPWVRELFWQEVKNVGKRILIAIRK